MFFIMGCYLRQVKLYLISYRIPCKAETGHVTTGVTPLTDHFCEFVTYGMMMRDGICDENWTEVN